MSFESSHPVERDGDIVSAADIDSLEQKSKGKIERIDQDDLDYSNRFAHEVAHAAERLLEQDDEAEEADHSPLPTQAEMEYDVYLEENEVRIKHEEQRAHAREFIDPVVDLQFEAMMERAKAIPQPHLRRSELARLQAVKVARMSESRRGRRA